MERESVINLVKAIPLPEIYKHYRYSNYGGKVIDEICMIQNDRSYLLANKGENYYLQIVLSTWYDRGPSDVSHSEIIEKRYYLLKNHNWELITASELVKLNNDLCWEPLSIGHV